MTVTLTLDWGSFVLGAAALLVLEFLVAFGVAVRQQSKNKGKKK